MKTLIYLTLTALSLLSAEARACDGPWRYLGHPPWMIVSAIADPDDRHQVLAGTWCGPIDPTGGGVWACADTDTVWSYAGLRGRRIFELSYYPYCRRNVFASTDNGLYIRTADTTWVRFSGSGGGILDQWDFTISPFDTSLWLLLLDDFGLGSMRISHDSGQHWEFFGPECSIYPLLWSHTLDNVFYFFGGGLNQGNTVDSTFRLLRVFSNDTPDFTAGHPQQPWIYVGGLQHLGRYDEVTQEILTVPLPTEVTHVYNVIYTESGLLVNTAQGFYHVSDDLSVWQADNVNSFAGTLLYTSSDRCLALNSDRLYLSAAPESVSPLRPMPMAPTVAVYPNPSNGGFIVSCDRPAQLRVYDLLGREVYRRDVERPGSIGLELPGLSSGTYYLKATNLYDSGQGSPAARLILIK